MFRRISPRKGRATEFLTPLVEIQECIKELEELVATIIQTDERDVSKKKKIENRDNYNDSVKFLKMDAPVEDRMVELIRRIAEITVQEEQKYSSSSSSWLPSEKSLNGASVAPNDSDSMIHGDDTKKEDRPIVMNNVGGNDVFEYFCEANVVSLFINIATGFAFTNQDHEDVEDLQNQDSLEFLQNESIDTNDAVADGLGNLSFDSSGNVTLLSSKRLPSVRIAIQVLQSMSILIQNVTMSTSLYLILSYNKVNELINLPLDSYAAAEKDQQEEEKMNHVHNNMAMDDDLNYGSSAVGEFSELTNIYISFLKSLTMKMNAETLQFYLTYPSYLSQEGSHRAAYNESSPYKQKAIDFNQIQFPLYERALKFCNPDVDPFVRVTAMNLCLNTLRLATDGDPLPPDGDCSFISEGGKQVNPPTTPQKSSNAASVTNDSLDNDRPDRQRNPRTTSKLPFRERLAISHYVCQPSRVQHLSAGIFTRLASLCGKVEETIRTLDRIDRALSSCFLTVDKCARESDSDAKLQADGRSSKNEGVSTSVHDDIQKKIKILQSERIKVVKHFLGDTVSDFQDELFLLEDVLKVGLIPLNEQIIEMMFPTVIYPLVLTPLHNFIKQNKRSVADEGGPHEPDPFSDRFEKHMSRPISRGASPSDSDSSLAKAALFVTAAIFHFITHKELLQLLMTALLHPLSPEISNACTIVHTNPNILFQDDNGYTHIKTDSCIENDEGLYLYKFGRDTANGNYGKMKSKGVVRQDCVFVFCPILSDIFEWSIAGSMLNGVPDNLTPNRYRRTLLSCLSGTDGMAELQSLAVYAIDAIVSTIDREILNCIIFGKHIFEEAEFRASETVENDESPASDTASNDIAFSTSISQHMVEFIASMCVSVITAAISYDGLWSLRYNPISAHAILRMCTIDPSVKDIATKFIHYRRNQSAVFILKTPSRLDKYAHDDKEIDHQLKMDKVFFEAFCEGDKFVVEHIIRSHGSDKDDIWNGPAMIATAKDGSIFQLAKQMCEDISAKHVIGHDSKEAAYHCAANSTVSHIQLDAFSRLIYDDILNQNMKDIGYAGVASLTLCIPTACEFHKSGNCFLISPISDLISDLLFEHEEECGECLKPGDVVNLDERKPFPCVCEITKENEDLNANGGTCIVADGVKWQSLYLLIMNDNLVLTEPMRGESAGYGRVVTTCPLLSIVAELYDIQDTESSAQRLLLTHLSVKKDTPGLFTAEKGEDAISSEEVRMSRSCLDVWFEDYNTASKAHKAICSRIFKVRIERGKRITQALSSHKNMT